MKKKSLSLNQNFALAVQNYKNRNFKTAEDLCKKIMNIDPDHFDSIFLSATLAGMNANFSKAKEFLLKANELRPNNLSVHNNLGNAYRELGEYKTAIEMYEKAIKIDSNHTNSYYNLGIAYYKLREFKKAKSYLQKTTAIQPNFALAYFTLGNVHAELKESTNAISCYQKAIELNSNIIGAHNNLGLVYRNLNDFSNAIKCYEKVIKIRPEHAGAHHNLALALKELGDFNKAIKSHESAIKLEPENLTNYFYLSELKKEILDENLKKKINKILLDKKCQNRNKAYGNFLLAKLEKKSKNYEKEIKFLSEGHKFFFELNKEKFDLGIKYCFDDMHQILKSANLEKTNSKNYNIKPIFIVGVPRCGSTLVEKIVASGEKNLPMGEESAVMENFINKKILEKNSVDLGSTEEIRNELYEIYKEKGLIFEKFDNTFTDKSLNNFFYINLIKEIYPNAKIINCSREPLSSIISIFSNNLTELAWVHNLDHIFKYFDNYFKIIENFKSIYPTYIYELKFEKFVTSPESESKNLFDFCELPWSKKCLEFYKRKDIISKTASNVQIRKAIFKNTAERYNPYKELLKKYSKKYPWFN